MGQCDFPTDDKYGLICDEARFLCGYEMDGFIGRLSSEKSPLPQPDPLCAGAGEADNIQWFSFITDDVNVEIVIKYSNCTGSILSPGLQVGIFESCELADDLSPLGSIYCIEDINYTDIVLTPDPLDIEVGQLYLLFIDGYAGSACDFEIDVIQGICTEAPDPIEECEQDCGVIYSNIDHKSCTLFLDTFMFDPLVQLSMGTSSCGLNSENVKLDSIICVEWDIQPDSGFNIISASFEYFDSLGVVPTLVVEWLEESEYIIKPIIHLNPRYSNCGGGCICTDEVAFSIDVSESTVVELDEVELCPDECIDFCGQTFCDAGIQKCFNREECLVEILSIVEKPVTEINKGLFYLCQGECFDFQGVTYCDPDNYSIADAVSCDTVYLFQLEQLNLSIELVNADDLLNCVIPSAFLEGQWNTNFNGDVNSAWVSELGDTLAFGNELTAIDAGNYMYVVWPEGFKDCAVSLMHTVTKDVNIPEASLVAPFLNCNNSFGRINIDTQDDIVSAQWNGPNGFISSDINAEVNEAGNYEVTITAANGCELTLMTEVFADFNVPVIELDFDNWTCSDETPVSQYTSSFSIDSHQWHLPNGSISTDEVLTLNSIGNYSIDFVAANGCKDSLDFSVVDLSYDPSLQLNQDRIWRCTDAEIFLDLSDKEVQGLKYLWTNIEGAVLSTSINLAISSPGTYILTIEDENVQCIGYDTVNIIEDPNPFVDVELSASAPLCQDGNDGKIEMVEFFGGESPYVFEINGETYTDVSEIGLAPGTYLLNIIDALNCVVSKNIEIPKAAEFNLSIEPEISVRFGKSKNLTFDTNIEESEISLIEWTDAEGNVLGVDRELEFVGKEIDFLFLKVENLEGCEANAQIKVNLSFEVDIFYPNVFSPNNDGNNDLFTLYNDGYPENADDLKIFDRKGELIYKSSQTQFNDSQIGWDGTFNGNQCQPGVYVFILEYTLMNGERKTLAGSITLVR